VKNLLLITLVLLPSLLVAETVTSFWRVNTDGVTASKISKVNKSKGHEIEKPFSYLMSTVFPTNSYEYWKLDASTNWVAMTQAEQEAVDQALLAEALDSSTWTAREEGLLKLIAEVGNITPREAKTKLKRHMNPTRIKKERKARRGN
jgi:hypothetical protein